MLARTSSRSLVPSPLFGDSSRFTDLGRPFLLKCRRYGSKAGAMAADSASSPNQSIKIGAMTERKIQGYPVSFSVYHNVQEGDTLTSISRQYNTPVDVIALANKIQDVDLVQAGQVLLVPVHAKVFQKVTALVLNDTSGETSTSQQGIVRTEVQQQTPPASLPGAFPGLRSFVKYATPFLLLAPVAVLCFRGLLEAAHHRIKLEVSRTQAEKEVRDAQHRPRLKRWQNILEGDRETEVPLPAGTEHGETETEEERKKREEDELRESYAELETRYMKFLADSGLSKSGYWRGGIPSSG